MYQPTLGRFMSRDPLGENGVDVLYDTIAFGDPSSEMRNLYAYVSNSPLNYVDPSGLRCISVLPSDIAIKDTAGKGSPPAGDWRPMPQRGTDLNFAGKKVLSFKNVQCGCCTMDIEMVARGYRYYRYLDDTIVDLRGDPTPEREDPTFFFSILVITVCRTNIQCGPYKMPDDISNVISNPLWKDGRGVFILQGLGNADIGSTLAGFATDAKGKPLDRACTYAADAARFVERNAIPGPPKK